MTLSCITCTFMQQSQQYCLAAGHVNRQAELLRASVAKGPIISVKRLISCHTYCSRLHVNQHMAEHLLPLLPEASNVKVGLVPFDAAASMLLC